MSAARGARPTPEVGRPDKELFPAAEGRPAVTKRDLADYYRRVASHMLRHVIGRAVTMHRFPEGIDGEGFYQKQAPDYFPDWIRTARLRKRGGFVDHVVVEAPETLVFLVDQACITPHVSLSRVDRPNYPDRLILDLDPERDDFDCVRKAALLLKDLLEAVDLRPFVMTTGSRGLHVTSPLDGKSDFDAVRAFARSLAEIAAAREPESLTTKTRIESRKGRVFIDWLRNGYAQTAVAPYAVRALPGAPVATPLDWHDLKKPSLSADRYGIRNLFRRLAQKEDPWRNLHRHARGLGGRASVLARLREREGLSDTASR